MRKVTFILPDGYDDIISITAIGGNGFFTNVANGIYDLKSRSEWLIDIDLKDEKTNGKENENDD